LKKSIEPITANFMESFRKYSIFDIALKSVFVLIIVAVMFGYAWYADLLPFGPEKSSTRLSPSVETIQQISNVVTSKEHQIIYYSFEDVLIVPDEQIPINALKKAFGSWGKSNHNSLAKVCIINTYWFSNM